MSATPESLPPGTVVDEAVAGERGLPSVNPPRAVDTRIANTLAMALVGVLGVAALGYYYVKVAARPAESKHAAETAARATAAGDSTVPPIGRVDAPRPAPVSTEASDAAEAEEGDAAEEADDGTWGDAPPAPPIEPPRLGGSHVRRSGDGAAAMPAQAASVPTPTSSSLTSVSEASADRRLRGPAFASTSDGGSASPAAIPMPAGQSELGRRLQPTVLAPAQATLLPDRRLLLPKGTFVDCTLETAIDSSLPGLVTCVTATDTFGADGRVVLLERGTRLIGETRGDTRAGNTRLFVLWSEARTPTGVVVELASPGTDALGRSGVTGEVDRHFSERFGAAILVSLIDGAIQAGVQSMRKGGDSLVVNPSGASDVMTQILKDTVAIPPTVRVAHGTRLQVLVARDLDFRSVYELDVLDPSR
jgi:type IV secretion system protein VirB10